MELEYIKQCFDFDSRLGVLIWKERPLEHFNTERGYKMWNSRYANTISSPKTKHTNGYRVVLINKKLFLQHRILFMLYTNSDIPSGMEIDHIDGNKINNTKENLRLVTTQENQRNVGINKNNTSGYVGIYFMKTRNKWKAQICVDRKSIYLGCFDTKDDAITARKLAENKYNFHKNHGRFA